MNIAEAIMKQYGLEEEEIFMIPEWFEDAVFRFKHGKLQIKDKDQWVNSLHFNIPNIFNKEIVKAPWVPKQGEKYWCYYAQDDTYAETTYTKTHTDICNIKLGNYAKTLEEAVNNKLEKIFEEVE